MRSICQKSENRGFLKKSLFDKFSKFSHFKHDHSVKCKKIARFWKFWQIFEILGFYTVITVKNEKNLPDFEIFWQIFEILRFYTVLTLKIDFLGLPVPAVGPPAYSKSRIGPKIFFLEVLFRVTNSVEHDLSVKRALATVIFEYSPKYRFLAFFRKLELAYPTSR